MGNIVKNAGDAVKSALNNAATTAKNNISSGRSSSGSSGSSGGGGSSSGNTSGGGSYVKSASGGETVFVPSGSNYGSTTGDRTLDVAADGNAPSGTQIGDTVVTAGGNYKVVSPGTTGATYNPSSGLWSIKVDSSTSGNKTVNVGSDGNAPAGTKIGDTVVTAGGNYKVVSPGTAGATYNPASGLWSIRISSGPYGSYNSTGSYHDANLSSSDAQRVKSLQELYEYYQAIGDKEGMDKAHANAEAIRESYGYSGGSDGSQYLPLEQEEDTLTKIGLPTYEAQTEAVENTYEAAKSKALAALQSSYDKSRLELENTMKEIPGTYQSQANQIAAEALKQQQNFNESAAYSGMNTGNGSQAQLAMNNQLQSNMSTLRTNEANAIAKVQQQLSTLYVEYQNSIAEAIANNEYEKAAALLSEYQKAAESLVSVAQSQASLDIDVADFNRETNQYNNEMTLQKAQDMAKYGDFSGYLQLGYSSDQVNNMKRGWLALNPEAAIYMGIY